jgi:hypothetical protein
MGKGMIRDIMNDALQNRNKVKKNTYFGENNIPKIIYCSIFYDAAVHKLSGEKFQRFGGNEHREFIYFLQQIINAL